MNLVIPMAGLGNRFRAAGFTLPKFLLQAHSRSLLEWSVDSLPIDLASSITFIGLKMHEEQYSLEIRIREIYKDYPLKFIWLDEPTRGQSETVLHSRGFIDPSLPLLVFNIDTAFKSSKLHEKLLASSSECSLIGAFTSSEPRFSYARPNAQTGKVDLVREKDVISPFALTGMYHFRTTQLFYDVATKAIDEGNLVKGEFYIAPLYNDLIECGESIYIDECDECAIIGTPEEYNDFLTTDTYKEL